MADQALNSASCTRGSRRGSRPRRIRERPDRGGLVGSAVAEMAAPEALAAVGLKHMEAAFAAVRAEKNAGAAEDTARQAKHRATYMTMACVAVADAVRQLTYKRAKKRMEQGNTQDGDEVIMRNYKSVAAYNAYVQPRPRHSLQEGEGDARGHNRRARDAGQQRSARDARDARAVARRPGDARRRARARARRRGGTAGRPTTGSFGRRRRHAAAAAAAGLRGRGRGRGRAAPVAAPLAVSAGAPVARRSGAAPLAIAAGAPARQAACRVASEARA